MTDKTPSIDWMATHIRGPVADPTATMEAWFRAHSSPGARCSRCAVPFTGDQATRAVCVVPDAEPAMLCPDCSDSFRAHDFLNIPNLIWLEIPLRKTT
jgi:hypothetical protein